MLLDELVVTNNFFLYLIFLSKHDACLLLGLALFFLLSPLITFSKRFAIVSLASSLSKFFNTSKRPLGLGSTLTYAQEQINHVCGPLEPKSQLDFILSFWPSPVPFPSNIKFLPSIILSPSLSTMIFFLYTNPVWPSFKLISFHGPQCPFLCRGMTPTVSWVPQYGAHLSVAYQ